MEEVKNFLKESGVYYLGTIDDNKPKVRPFGTIEIYDNHLYIQTSKRKDVFKQIEKNNNVEICAFNGEEWIRIETKLIRDERVEAKKDMLDNYPELRSMYDENDDNSEVLYMENATATIYSFTQEPRTYKF